MSKPVLIVKNVPHEGPSLLAEVLDARGIPFTLVDLEGGDPFPAVETFGAVVVLGGPDSANDQNAKMTTELSRIRDVLEAKIPYLGICLGLQTLVKAAGGSVVKSSTKEIGLFDPAGNPFTVELTESGRTDTLFTGLESVFEVFHLHGETVELTADMKLLGTGKFCHNQIVKVRDHAYGIQCHFELTPEMFESWLGIDRDLQLLDKTALRRRFEEIRENYTAVGKQLFANFLSIAGYLA